MGRLAKIYGACFVASIGVLWLTLQICAYFGHKLLEGAGFAGYLISFSILMNLTLVAGTIKVLREKHVNPFLNTGITNVFTSRKDYAKYRKEGETIDSYISTAQHSLVMVSVNLMTGVAFDGISRAIEKMLTNSDNKIFVTISLINPSNKDLLCSLAPVLDMEPVNLRNDIVKTLQLLFDLKSNLSGDSKNRFSIKVHNAIPFASAIIIDHKHDNGRIQIETKPYKAPFGDSFAIEVVPRKKDSLYHRLCNGYERLLDDGTIVTSDFLSQVTQLKKNASRRSKKA